MVAGDRGPGVASMRVSVVVPVRDGAELLSECLAALAASLEPAIEVVVVDDDSRDASAAVAERAGARVLRLAPHVGAAAARNEGVRIASGDVLVFVDADVVVRPDTVSALAGVLRAHPEVAAVFGSYDATPRAPGFVSQYRNLLHHFVHQHGARDAATFWAGCGAIRRAAFESVGGFVAATVGIEDIELGYLLRAAGHRIRLEPSIQVTHLKRWTLRSVLWTDALWRALPWSRLLLARGTPHDHLNLQARQRASVALALVAAVALPLALVRPAFGLLAAAAVLGMVAANRGLLAFFARARGLPFAIATVPLLALHYLESGVCYLAAWLEHALGRHPASGASS